jgi:hypothetical protein
LCARATATRSRRRVAVLDALIGEIRLEAEIVADGQHTVKYCAGFGVAALTLVHARERTGRGFHSALSVSASGTRSDEKRRRFALRFERRR